MNGGNAIRGTRIGAAPQIGESVGVVPAPRASVSYWCARGHEVVATFAEESLEDAPETWDCPRCGLPAGLDRENPPAPPQHEVYKTHLDYVKERRSDEDGAALLEDTLAALRARRTQQAEQKK